MEFVIALLLIFLVGMLFLQVLPFLLPLFLILLIVSIYRSYRARKQFEQHVEQSRPHDPHERGQERQGAGDVIDVAIFRDAAYERQRDGYRSSGIIRIGGLPFQCHGLRFRNEIE